MKSARGFTLIELLIVISIIAVLSTIGLVAYGNFLKSSRDSRRQSELKLIQSALEEYHSDLIAYPATLPSGGTTFDSSTGRGSLTAPATTKTYLRSVPQDPTPSTTTPYCYKSTLLNGSDCDNTDSSDTHRCASYILYAKLEIPPPGSTNSTCGTVTTYNFQMTPP